MPKPHHLKNIKNIVRKQLKNKYPNFYRLSKNEKKEVLENTANAVMEEYDFHKEINAANYDMVDWDLINSFLSPSNYTPGKREILPVNFFRAELLKHLKYPEISYRKFDEREINNPERKENRAFIGIDRNKSITHHQHLDSDTGMRRNKRDKSKYIVGYRLHTLTVVDTKEEKAYPLLSLLSPANHHDSNFLKPLVELGKAIGLELNIIAGDQAYGEVEETEALKQKHNVTILNTPKSLTKLAKYVDEKTFTVRKNADCSADMEYRGKDEEYGHEFHCDITFGQCPFEGNCNKIRHIKVDSGVFGQIPYFYEGAQKVVAMRKVAERPFNLIKHRDVFINRMNN